MDQKELETGDPEKSHSEKDSFAKDGSEKSHPVKLKCEDTMTSRQESVAINMEDIPEYQIKSSAKKKKLAKKWEMITTKIDKKKGNNILFQRNYFVFAVDEGEPFDYDPDTRNGFVAKIFLMVFVMLLCNAIVAFGVRSWDFLIQLMFENYIVVAVILGLALVTLCIIHIGIIYYEYMSKSPCTWVNLILAFICNTVILAVVTLIYHSTLIFAAIGLTAVIVLICFCLALTRIDFTKCWIVAIVMLVAAIASSLLIVILRACGIYMTPMHMASLGLGVTAISFFLIIQLQMVLGGRDVEFSEDDLALPTLLVYTSIIGIFLKLLKLLQLTGWFDMSEIFSSD